MALQVGIVGLPNVGKSTLFNAVSNNAKAQASNYRFCTIDPNVGQVLSLMNGFVQKKLVNRSGAHLYKSLEGVESDAEKIRRLYLAILSRTPTAEELALMLDEFAARGDEGCRNVVSSLVTSSEFLFLQ